jgi:hypothetical protein
VTRKSTRHSLGLFWHGEEADGFTIYGYWPGHHETQPSLNFAHWPDVETKTSRLGGRDWTVWLWDVRVHKWPEAPQWRSAVLDPLAQLLGVGARVAWCGLEGGFVDPPGLFDPLRMAGGVWAARVSGADGIFEPPGLDAPFTALTDDQLTRLRQAAGFGP